MDFKSGVAQLHHLSRNKLDAPALPLPFLPLLPKPASLHTKSLFLPLSPHKLAQSLFLLRSETSASKNAIASGEYMDRGPIWPNLPEPVSQYWMDYLKLGSGCPYLFTSYVSFPSGKFPYIFTSSPSYLGASFSYYSLVACNSIKYFPLFINRENFERVVFL